jgi:hypothetical protein
MVMANEFKITSNAIELDRTLRLIGGRHIPFATARALTNIAYRLKDVEKSKISKYFEVRTKWSPNTLRAGRALKADYPRAFSTISVRDDVMAIAAMGGHREGNGAIPGRRARKILNPSNETLGPKYFPGKLIKAGDKMKKGTRGKTKHKNRVFTFTSKRGPSAGEKVMAIRRGGARLPLDVLYVFPNSRPYIKKRWPLIPNVTAGVARLYQPMFLKSLYQAINN